jgi:DNA mismatch endonuclease, patch repair protein
MVKRRGRDCPGNSESRKHRRMPDHLSREGRSRVMAAIRSRNTRPELAVRAALRRVGVSGYRVHLKTLPGRPDIAFTRWKVAIFVDGAFWHGHPAHFDSSKASPFWQAKIAGNRERDRVADEALVAAGWAVVRCWDFEVNESIGQTVERILEALRAVGWSSETDLGD